MAKFKCKSCGCKFDSSKSISGVQIGGKGSILCPACGSAEVEEL